MGEVFVSRDHAPSNTAVTSGQSQSAAWSAEQNSAGSWDVVAGKPDTYSPVVASIWPGFGETEARRIAATSELVEALKPFADLGVGSGPDDEHDAHSYRILRGAIRKARAALAKAEGK